VSNALKIPSIQTMISGLKLEMYSGQRSNVDKWTPMQRLGFVVGVGRGISMPEWQQAFGLSESTIQKIYAALGLSRRESLSVYRGGKPEDWEVELAQEWLESGLSMSEISSRLLRSELQMARGLGVSEPVRMSLVKSSDFHSSIVEHHLGIDLQELSAQLASFFDGVDHARIRTLQASYPLALASAILEVCEEELKKWWRWMANQPSIPLSYKRVQWLESLVRTGALPQQDMANAEQIRQDLEAVGVAWNGWETWLPKSGSLLEEWERTLLKEWQTEIEHSEAARRLMRPTTEVPWVETKHVAQVVARTIQSKRGLPDANPILSEIERINICTKCHRSTISPPYPTCQRCLLQSLSPISNPGRVPTVIDQ
jgi:transposase